MGNFRLLILLLSLNACSDNKVSPCTAAYDHLLAISKQEHDSDTGKRFVDACVAAWDESRVACLMASTTPDEAKACRAGRVPPG
jgi:hypothetical protein